MLRKDRLDLHIFGGHRKLVVGDLNIVRHDFPSDKVAVCIRIGRQGDLRPFRGKSYRSRGRAVAIGIHGHSAKIQRRTRAALFAVRIVAVFFRNRSNCKGIASGLDNRKFTACPRHNDRLAVCLTVLVELDGITAGVLHFVLGGRCLAGRCTCQAEVLRCDKLGLADGDGDTIGQSDGVKSGGVRVGPHRARAQGNGLVLGHIRVEEVAADHPSEVIAPRQSAAGKGQHHINIGTPSKVLDGVPLTEAVTGLALRSTVTAAVLEFRFPLPL